MSVALWPPIDPAALASAEADTQRRELEWLLDTLRETLRELKQGLEDCYALLAPVDPGSTLVLSTPRNEVVKGHITRVGTRIVRGTIHLRLRTIPHQTLTISPDHPIHLAPLITIHNTLTSSIDLLALTLSYVDPSAPPTPARETPHTSASPGSHATFIAAQLRLLSTSLADACAILKGPPLAAPADPSWTATSCSAAHFNPPLEDGISFHLGVQDSQIVLWLRALEPADAPVHFGTKLALAIGTARRLEHDEADKVFEYTPVSATAEPGQGQAGTGRKEADIGPWAGREVGRAQPVYVREKVRVESADPSLLAVSAKLNALGHALTMARRNLAAVMDEEMDS